MQDSSSDMEVHVLMLLLRFPFLSPSPLLCTAARVRTRRALVLPVSSDARPWM